MYYETGITETISTTRITSLPPRKLPLFTLPCTVVPVLTIWFIHIQSLLYSICASWENSYCGFNLSIFFSVWGQSGHCCNLLCFNPQEASVHPPTRACQALLGLMAWRKTFWLKTTAVLFSHPVRQSNIIFEELHNK